MHVTFLFYSASPGSDRAAFTFIKHFAEKYTNINMEEFVSLAPDFFFPDCVHRNFVIAMPVEDLKGPYAEKFYEHLSFYQQAGVSIDFLASLNLAHNIPS